MDLLDLIAAGKIKRYFRATKKLNAPGIVSHITQRAAGKEPLFLEDEDYLFMLKSIKEISKKYFLEIYAFCLMSNHIHLLLSPQEANLEDTMRNLFSRYAMYFNRKYERKGHLFGGPYRQAVCFDDRYLLSASLYIHLNPLHAAIVTDPMKYRWTSISLYSVKNPPKSFVNPNFVLELLSNGNNGRIERYRRMLKEGSLIKTGQVSERQDAVERLGSKLMLKFPKIFKRMESKKKIAELSGTELLGFENLEKKIDQIKAGSAKNSPQIRKAKRYLIEQLLARGFTRTEIAEKLGLSRKTIYNILKTSQ